MTATKQQLGELIEAYAAARATGNNLLIQTSANSLVQFIDSCEITHPEAAPPEPAEEAITENPETEVVSLT